MKHHEKTTRAQAWALYWRGIGPRPIPVDFERVRRVAQQIRDYREPHDTAMKDAPQNDY